MSSFLGWCAGHYLFNHYHTLFEFNSPWDWFTKHERTYFQAVQADTHIQDLVSILLTAWAFSLTSTEDLG
jgi:hypothetical protein